MNITRHIVRDSDSITILITANNKTSNLLHASIKVNIEDIVADENGMKVDKFQLLSASIPSNFIPNQLNDIIILASSFILPAISLAHIDNITSLPSHNMQYIFNHITKLHNIHSPVKKAISLLFAVFCRDIDDEQGLAAKYQNLYLPPNTCMQISLRFTQ